MSVTFFVLKLEKSRKGRALHSLNISLMLVTVAVLKFDRLREGRA